MINDSSDQPRSLRLPSWLLRVLIAVVVLLIILVTFGALSYSRLSNRASLADDLQIENQILRDYTERVHRLEKDLQTNHILLRRMMELAGIEASPEFPSADSIQSEAELVGLSERIEPAAADTDGDTDPSVPEGIPMSGTISRSFVPDESEELRRHFGLDIAAKEGSPVYATASGRVEFAGWDETFGNYLILDQLNGYKTYYGHNRAILVSVGDAIRKNELIALCGNTGRSSAPHLHYEIRYEGAPVNPEEYMNVELLKQAE
ncbi:MAG: M23 family metallopeptidase [candidate division Zixibacteria bacterium]|nr:M23 family metallopeptidase [candidate division Zixibacteria bacterium]